MSEDWVALSCCLAKTGRGQWGGTLLRPCWSLRVKATAALPCSLAWAFSCSQPKTGRFTQTKHSLAAFLEPMDLQSQVLHWLSEACKHILPHRLYNPLLKPAGVCDPHRGCPLISLGPGGQRVWCSWTPQECNSWKDSSYQATIPGHCIDSRLKNNPSLPMKKPYLPAWSLSLRDRSQVSHS